MRSTTLAIVVGLITFLGLELVLPISHAVSPWVPPAVPAMLMRVGGCESAGSPTATPRQFNPDGSVLRGKINPHDIGEFQINELFWGTQAVKLGFDIFTAEGNRDMALWIFENYGLRPWGWSRHCWATSSAAPSLP